MFEKYNFKPLILITNSKKNSVKSISDLTHNPENVLIVSLDVKNVERFVNKLNKFNFEEFNIHLIQPGTLEDDTNIFQLLNEILSESKCKVFILQNEFSNLKNFFQAADISNYYANIHIIHSSLAQLEEEFSVFNIKSFRTILNIGVSGHQQHLSENADITHSHFDNYRLGNVISQIEVLNKPLQYADCTVVDLSVVKQSDLPSKNEVGSSGFTSEMFNQIARSIGGSNKNRFTILSGFDRLSEDPDPISTDTISQFIYYYISGANKIRFNKEVDNETIFVIDECLPYQSVNFTKNEMTMEWTANYPAELPEELSHFSKVPCTYNDYLYSGQGELSPRILEIFQSLDRLREELLQL